MTNWFFTDKQVAALRGLTTPTMKTPVSIYRRSVSENAYGDDSVAYTLVGSAYGWLYSTPTTIQEIDTGALVTANTYRLFMPVDTDVLAGDEVEIESSRYIVSDTTFESTWNVVVRCSLRRRE